MARSAKTLKSLRSSGLSSATSRLGLGKRFVERAGGRGGGGGSGGLGGGSGGGGGGGSTKMIQRDMPKKPSTNADSHWPPEQFTRIGHRRRALCFRETSSHSFQPSFFSKTGSVFPFWDPQSLSAFPPGFGKRVFLDCEPRCGA